MAIHILNCGTIQPHFSPVRNGVTCPLVETSQRPVLVDTGLGTGDLLLHPGRLMRFVIAAKRLPRDPHEMGFHQVQQYGYQPTEAGRRVGNISETTARMARTGCCMR